MTEEEIPWDIPDKALYHPRFQPWEGADWQARLLIDPTRSLVSLDRQYVLYNLLLQMLRTVRGDVAECGVYKGGTAHLFAGLMQQYGSSKKLYLYDSFEGMPETNKTYDLHSKGDFADTSLASVRDYLREFGNIVFRQGFIPHTFAGMEAGHQFCFTHVDLDIHDAVLDASKHFYPRTPVGGVLVYDDYGFPSCPGARRAVDTFYADKPERPLVLSTGQCLVFKTAR
ncbi:MAG TPA: TylF/MycF/NovP-related O-methyltransferase [Candidatus Elarobacter sp.]|jgi:O-methyltransferase|nr:TylF/MycF/NovP-related O-methyltransferase [Candidatus Elarobacter sp.]